MMDIERFINEHSSEFVDVSRRIWEYAEVAFEEEKSAECLIQLLEKNGFRISRNTAGLSTAFTAEYGEGGPVIALFAEYDALSGLSQEILPVKKSEPGKTAGHGCGHNLLGTASAAAALAVKEAIDCGEVKGKIRVYGTPAEEVLLGKVIMAKAGVFCDVDAALGWHPERYNGLLENKFTGVNSAKFHFHGRTAHAAVDPYNGRSALDAVELLNVSANYLREHVPRSVSFHYSTLCKEFAPNIVPEDAAAWYYVRGASRQEVDEVYQRLCRCAFAAAEMTDTTCTEEFLGGCSDYAPNRTLESVIYEEMKDSSLPTYTKEEMDFVREISEGLEEVARGSRHTMMEEYGKDVSGKFICDFWAPPSEVKRGKILLGSMDLGDVSQVIPTAQFSIACYGYAITGHSWQVTAYAGHSVGQKGMLKAAEILAKSAVKLMTSPEILEKAKEEFEQMNPEPYKSPLPDDFRY